MTAKPSTETMPPSNPAPFLAGNRFSAAIATRDSESLDRRRELDVLVSTARIVSLLRCSDQACSYQNNSRGILEELWSGALGKFHDMAPTLLRDDRKKMGL